MFASRIHGIQQLYNGLLVPWLIKLMMMKIQKKIIRSFENTITTGVVGVLM
jgi:hypothetical protein